MVQNHFFLQLKYAKHLVGLMLTDVQVSTCRFMQNFIIE